MEKTRGKIQAKGGMMVWWYEESNPDQSSQNAGPDNWGVSKRQVMQISKSNARCNAMLR